MPTKTGEMIIPRKTDRIIAYIELGYILNDTVNKIRYKEETNITISMTFFTENYIVRLKVFQNFGQSVKFAPCLFGFYQDA